MAQTGIKLQTKIRTMCPKREKDIHTTVYFNIVAVIMLVCLGIIIYSNTFYSSFHFDDKDSIVINLSIRNFRNLKAIWDFWPTRFITYISIALNYHLNQLNVFGYHLFNLIVHVGSTILLWWFTLLIFRTPSLRDKKIANHANLIALFVGLIFLTHPVQTQGVTYIIQRAVSLATLFYLASLNLYAKSRLLQYERQTLGIWRLYYAGSMMTTVIAMFTKEITITLPFMVLLYEFCFLKTKKGINWKYLIPFLITFLIIPLTMLATKSVNFVEMRRVVEPASNISPTHYLLTQFNVIVTYLRLLFIPLNQNLDYDYLIAQTLLALPTLASLFFLIFILIIAIWIFPKYGLISFSIFWFFLSLLPESSIIPIKDVIFEHRLYLPMVGYSLFLVSIMYYLFGNKALRPIVTILIMIVACYSILTYTRNFFWKDEFILWNDTVHKSPQKARPYNNRGNAYFNKGEYGRAMVDFNQALKLNPNYADAYYNRANIYFHKGTYDKAILDYNQALKLNPNYADAYYNRANIYFHKGTYDKAILDYNQALKINPGFTKAYNNRGNAYSYKREYDKALFDYNQALKVDPEFAESYYNRAMVYLVKKDYERMWQDIDKAKVLGMKIDSKFIEKLQNDSVEGKLRF